MGTSVETVCRRAVCVLPVQKGKQGESVVQNVDPPPWKKLEFVVNLPGGFLLSGRL